MEESPQTPEAAAQTDTISLLDLIGVMVKHRLLIIVSTLAAALLIVLYSLYTLTAPPDAPFNRMPNEFTPEVKVRLQDTASDAVSSVLKGSDLGILAGLTGNVPGPSNADLAIDLLSGNRLVDMVEEKFGFVGRFGITENPRTVSRKIIRSATETEYDKTTGILSIRFSDTDPVFATDVLNFMLDSLEIRFSELTNENIETKKEFLIQRLSEVEEEVRRTQEDLIRFQRENGIFDLELQAGQQIQEIAELSSAITRLELDLMSLLEYRQENDPQVVRLRNDLERSKVLLASKQSGFGDFSIKGIPQDRMPEITANYLNLNRDLSIHEALYMMLRQEFEAVKLEEKDNSRTFQVIERAEVPEMKSRPSRGKISMVVTIAVFFLSVFLSFILEYFERVKLDPLESEKLRSIKAMIRKPRKT